MVEHLFDKVCSRNGQTIKIIKKFAHSPKESENSNFEQEMKDLFEGYNHWKTHCEDSSTEYASTKKPTLAGYFT